MKKKDFVVRFAGEGGQGVVTSAEGLAQAMAQSGYNVQTFSTFPSQIRGGPTWTQTRISTSEVLSPGDELDVLVAFNEYAYANHKEEVADDGVIVFNNGEFEIEESENVLGMDFDKLAKQTGNNRAANFVVMGALARLVDLPLSVLEEFNRQRYTRGRPSDEQIISSNNMALSLGSEEADKSGFSLGELADPIKPEGDQVLINGNIAVSLGATAAGLDVFVGYPISPATPILLWMEQNLVGPGKFVYQSTSEIESITSIVGAGFAGKKAMTSTAGPGFSLMGEGLGLAWMAEIPLVVVDVQRGGPSTGLPTKTEQSDLMTALYPGHGDMKLPVIAPGTVEECFYAGVMAVNWAERYQGPVVLLSEHAMSERRQNIPRPDANNVGVEIRKSYEGSNGYLRYDGFELSPMPIPGGPGSYIANGSEHDAMGDTTHLPSRHVQMTERRFSKLNLLNDGTFEEDNNKNTNIAIVPWGGSKGPALAAYNALREENVDVGWCYTMYLHPMPEKMLEVLKSKELVIVPELNYMGQFSSVLRSEGIKAVSITKYTGLPFKESELIERIRKIVESLVIKGVMA
ncbi:MAG: 2-oxoacid:acceptor oxidoreductase subunit alpha [SAR202 cluster bacterium]|nr:2-oxoacid:acceptor oxidoreductase subunit alpha [SAR202 cluster bacterium]